MHNPCTTHTLSKTVRIEPLTGEPAGGAARAAADAVARRSYGKLVAYLAASCRDLAAAEDALSEAFAAALGDWPRRGCPANPEAWLLTVARRRLVDQARRRQTRAAGAGTLALLAEGLAAAGTAPGLPDRRLGLLFACAHPALEPGVRAPLMLQAVLGLDAARIASAFLTSPAAMAKRLVRAKSRIRMAGIPFALPDAEELAPRLDAVLEAIYAAFAEGWTDPGGTDAARRDLVAEAIYLARLVAGLLPGAPPRGEGARGAPASPARRDAAGAYVPLGWQDPGRWDAAMIAEAETLLVRASRLGAIGRFQLEAALQSAHVHRGRGGVADWPRVVELYDALLALSASPVVAVNRAVAVAGRDGPAAGLAALDAVAGDPRLAEYQPYWAARADLLARSGAVEPARAAYGLAIGLERDPAVRSFLQECRAALPG